MVADHRFDCVVLGSGIAGLSFALNVAEKISVAVITKKNRAESNTNYAQGGIACVTSTEDTFDLHVRDTLEAGAGLCREDVVRGIVEEGPARIKELIELGMAFTERENGNGHELDLGREGGHSKRRILHAKDITGREIETALLTALALHPNVEMFENHAAIDLITRRKLGFSTDNRCVGVYVLDIKSGRVKTVAAPHVLLATGGCGKVYLYTTNPDIATGDGVAMAYRAGVPVANMEFIQFHPTCLFHPKAKSFLISEAVRGEGGILRNSAGKAFMDGVHPLKSLAPRDIVARAIDTEIKKTGAECVYLDITHKSRDFLKHRFPGIYGKCLEFDIDMAVQPIPVVPGAHYQCGGVVTTPEGRTELPGLWAVGEVGCTGLHGANRLASNSLLEALVVAHRAAEAVKREKLPEPQKDLPPWESGSAQDPDELVVIYHNWREIRQLMWDYVGIVRTTKRLLRAASRLRSLSEEVREYYWNGAATEALSPDGTALLVLTSGYNTDFRTETNTPITHVVPDPRTGRPSKVSTPNAEWVFVYDVRGAAPALRQRLSLPNTYHGLVWDKSGARFYVSGGIDDRVYPFNASGGGSAADRQFAIDAPFIPLGHNTGGAAPLPAYDGGLFKATPIGQSPKLLQAVDGATSALAAGIDLSRDGKTLAVVNMQNDSLSLVDTHTRLVTREVHFFTPGQTEAVGELPYWVCVRSDASGAFARAYVTSQRDGQVLSVGADGSWKFLTFGGEPNRMVLSADQTRLYVANGDRDEIDVIDTATDTPRRRILLLRPGDTKLGAGPDGLALSPDGATLYVSLGNENAVAALDVATGQVRGRIPTGWYPSDVAPSRDGSRLFVINTKNLAGPSDYALARGNDDPAPRPDGHNGYVLALEKAGLLSFPVPDTPSLAKLSAQVDANNQFGRRKPDPMMAFLHDHIHHVIFVLKENRTYDQVLGDLKQGNGDPALTQFPRPVTPNNHALAERFALLDNFDTAGDVSGDGWNWTFQGHANVYTNRTVAVEYGNAHEHLPFDWNGNPRDIDVALPDHAPHPGPATVRLTTLLDPSGKSAIEPGGKDVTAGEGADEDKPGGAGGYIWDAALRAGRTVRHYGVYTDTDYYIPGSPFYIPVVRDAARAGTLQAVPSRPALLGRTDPYYRGWDLNTPDQYRFEAWQREFNQYVAHGNLPDLEVMVLMMDHFGDFGTNVAHLNTPTLQIASNDYAIGQLTEALSHSPYWKDTAIFIVEDDAQDGPDHVDAHRTVAHVISAYTRPGAVISTRYDSTSMLRTMEDILGIDTLGLNDANAAPMSDVFSRTPDLRPYDAIIPGVLCRSPVDPSLVPQCRAPGHDVTQAAPGTHDGAWWARATQGMDFSRPDQIQLRPL